MASVIANDTVVKERPIKKAKERKAPGKVAPDTSSAIPDDTPVTESETEKDPVTEESPQEFGPKRNSKRELGARGEEAAARYLERQEFEILERNWKCSYGEADIIAREDDDIVFIEVKTRKGIEKGMPEDAVTPTKRDRYERIAASFLENNAFVNCFVRFDVIAILVVGENRALLRHHRGAFSSGD